MRKGIPTVYNGRRYRSRLEARWARFFDLLGWRHEYEPFDLDGWIPDFLLPDANLLVEVKPVTSFPCDVAEKITRSTREEPKEALILGCTIPVLPIQTPPCPRLLGPQYGLPMGWMLAFPANWNPHLSPCWGTALVQRFGDESLDYPDMSKMTWIDSGWGLYSSVDHFMHCDPGYQSQIKDENLFGLAHNRIHIGSSDMKPWATAAPDPAEMMPDMWAQAGNAVQYDPWKSLR